MLPWHCSEWILRTNYSKQEHMRGTTGEQKMYSRITWDEQQRFSRGTTPNLAKHDTNIFIWTIECNYAHPYILCRSPLMSHFTYPNIAEILRTYLYQNIWRNINRHEDPRPHFSMTIKHTLLSHLLLHRL